MKQSTQPVLSVVVPLYNEAASLPSFYASLHAVLENIGASYEVLFVNDGSIDRSARLLEDIADNTPAVRVISLTRNFGKEVATTAGIHLARGQAILTLDADGQHPVDRIPEFVQLWQSGAKVVIGHRSSRHSGFMKRLGTRLFYGVFRRLMGVRIDPDATDFRLIDQTVQAQFNTLTEHRRITRGLIDWLGYDRAYVTYTENPRLHGQATYSLRKLSKLAVDSAISLSISPLYVTAYIGAVVLPLATILGLGMVGNWALGDPLGVHATGGAYVIVIILWLIGVLLVSQGIIGLYLSHIHTETQNRPLYVVDEAHSKGIA